MLDIYFIYFDTLQHKLFYVCKVLKKCGIFSKTFQSYSFGDQQCTEPLIDRHTQFFTSTTHLTMAMVYLIELISRVYRSHLFKLQKEHESRMDTSLLVINLSSHNVHLIITTTLFPLGQLGSRTISHKKL